MNDALPILVVGGGPSGLTAALELARRGRSVRVIDQAGGPSEHSKAIGVNARTLTLLEGSGVTQRMLAEGMPIPRGNIRRDGRLLYSIEFTRVNHRYNYMLALPQSRSEALLAEALDEYGVKVEYACELMHYRIENGVVRAVTKTPRGQGAIEASLLIGADGAHSTVRERLGMRISSEPWARPWSLADVEMDWPWPHNEVTIMRSGPALFFCIGLPNGGFRIAADRPGVAELAPRNAKIHKVLWGSEFHITNRLVQRYQQGPVFLIGDAAHTHSPVGARGMNLGIEDACVLARMIEEGDTAAFTTRRRREGAKALRETTWQTRMIIGDGPLTSLLRNHLAPALLGVQALNRLQARRMLGL